MLAVNVIMEPGPHYLAAKAAYVESAQQLEARAAVVASPKRRDMLLRLAAGWRSHAACANGETSPLAKATPSSKS